MIEPAFDLVVWNAQWRTRSRSAPLIRELLWRDAPSIVCLTEAHEGFAPEQRTIASQADYGYPLIAGRRKVQLWSASSWDEVDTFGGPGLPGGRFVRGRTRTPAGSVTIVGVCIPWPAAHVSSGRRDRMWWEDHKAYLDALGTILSGLPRPLIVAGDFNQHVPRRNAPRDVFDRLQRAISPGLSVVTAGLLPPPIDHVAVSPELRAVAKSVIPATLPDGSTISDHNGVRVRLARA